MIVASLIIDVRFPTPPSYTLSTVSEESRYLQKAATRLNDLAEAPWLERLRGVSPGEI